MGLHPMLSVSLRKKKAIMNKGIRNLTDYFTQGCKENREFHIGLEVEHFILNRKTHKTMIFDGKHGVGALMEQLFDDFPEKHMEDGAVISLESEDILITLEPGCQLEISTAPFDSVEKVMQVYRSARKKVEEVLDSWEYDLVTEGYLPYGKAEDIPLIGKERYRCMDRYFERTGIYGKNMMRATAACHVSVDYFDEEDFVNKYRLAWLLDPLFALLTENVSCFEGKDFHGHLLRGTIWQGVDPGRTGICPDIFEEDFGFASYARWLMKVPVIVVKDGDIYRYEPGKTIGQCFETYGGEEALIKHYLSMAFPDVRLKQFIEIRSGDSMPENYVEAYCSLIKGIFGNEETVVKMLSLLPQDISAIRDTKTSLKANGHKGLAYGQDVRLMLYWLLNEASANLEGQACEALELWYPLIENETNMQGVTEK